MARCFASGVQPLSHIQRKPKSCCECASASVAPTPIWAVIRFEEVSAITRCNAGPSQEDVIRVDPTVELAFRYSEEDYVRAMQAHYASRLRPKLDITIAVILASIGIYFWRSPEWRLYGMAAVGVSVIFLCMLIAAFGIIPRVVFRREAKFKDDYTLAFAADGIHFRTIHIDSHLQWSMYSHVLVTRHSYILYYGAGSFTVIPKRVFKDAEQWKTFEELLSSKVAQLVRKA